MKRNLTNRFIESIKPKPGKRETVFDTRQPGLAIRVTDRGHRRFYVMSRGPDGKQKWAEVRDGNATVTSLARARELAPEGLARIKNGRTAFPKIEPPVEEELDTYEAVRERFIRQYAEPRQRTWKETERILKALPWDKRLIEEITKKDAIKFLNDLIAADKKATARVTLSWLKAMWRWAWRQDLIDFPVMDALKPEDFGITKVVRARTYSDDELAELWRATGKLGRREQAYVKLLMLLGVRRGALRGMRKSEFDDLERPTVWTIPPERTKTRKSRETEGRVYKIPIPPLARRVLVPLLKGDGDLVFPSPTLKGQAADFGTPYRLKVRDASGVADWTAHAHRHSIATWRQNEAHDEYDRGLVLNHASSGSVTAGYSHGYSLDRARALLDKWAEHVAGVVAAEGVELLA